MPDVTDTLRLAEVIGQLSAGIRRAMLCASFTYSRPRRSVPPEPASIEIVVRDALSFAHIRAQLANSVEALALSAREDLALIVNLMEAVQDEIPFAEFEAVEVRRAGSLLLRIVMPSRAATWIKPPSPGDPSIVQSTGRESPRGNVGRIACIEINDYLKEILRFVTPTRTSPFTYAVFAAGIAIGIGLSVGTNLLPLLAAWRM